MGIWFTSDTHFGSERTRQLSKRDFYSITSMDEAMINNWNNNIDKYDTVYHLGDFGDYYNAKELNGEIILILGNYDREEYYNNKELFKDFKQVITEDVHRIWIHHNNKRYDINMAHEPSKLDKFRNINEINLFGHIHKLQMVKPFGLNVGTDCHDFTPVDLDTVIFYDNAIRNYYDDEVFIK